MATFTRKAIMQTFLHILKNKPLDRITVKDICEQCEINRNTFYYYFKDIYDVLEAIFEDEVRLVMDEAKEGVTFHDAYARVAALILNNREAIMHIYASENGRVLRTYLDAVVTQVVRRFVLEKAEGYSLDDSDIAFITAFYSNGIVGSTIKWIERGSMMSRLPENITANGVGLSKSQYNRDIVYSNRHFYVGRWSVQDTDCSGSKAFWHREMVAHTRDVVCSGICGNTASCDTI